MCCGFWRVICPQNAVWSLAAKEFFFMLTLKKVERPRELKWYQAGAMLYGDWGTSKAYVLGIAFALSGHASWFYLGLMSCLTALVGVCYMVICRIFPDGG